MRIGARKDGDLWKAPMEGYEILGQGDTVPFYLSESQIFLSFDSDKGAALFRDWLVGEGHELFEAYASIHQEDYP